MTLNITNRLDLQALSALDDNHYLYAQQRGDQQIRTSAQPIKGSFLCFAVGTSKQHRYGFVQLKAQVQRQFGFELQADHAGSGKITAGSLKRQIAEAQAKNAGDYQALLDQVQTTYGQHGDAFAENQMKYVFNQVLDDFAAGHVLTDARKQQISNQLEIRDFAHSLEDRFGGGAGNTFVAAVQAKLNNGEKLTEAEKTRWLARCSAQKAVQGLGGRIQDKLGAPAQQAAVTALNAKVAALTNANTQLPVELTQHGQIPQAWADEAIDAARQAHVDNLDGGLDPNQREQAVALAQGRAVALKSQQGRIGQLERVIAGTVKDARLDEHPTALFRPGGDIYQRCEDLVAIRRDPALARLQSWRDPSAQAGARLTDAQHIARLGLQLRQNNVPPHEAEYILHMEATLRAKGAGNAQADQFAPLLGNLQEARQLAQQAIALETNGQPNLSKRTVGQLLELEMAERVANRGALVFQQLSPKTAELVQDRAGLARLQRYEVPLTLYGDYRQRGAQNADEVVQCVRLGVDPDVLHKDKSASTRQIFAQWHNAGFSEVETQAYLLHFDSPERARPFRGSLLKPGEYAAYFAYRIPLKGKTELGNYRDEELLSEPKSIGSGAYNTVYGTRYRRPEAPNGFVDRVFKPDPGAGLGGPGSLGKTSLRNCLASALDRQIGFNVLAHSEMAMLRGHLGISMSRAKGDEAYAQQIGYRHTEVVTPQSKYAALLRLDRNRLMHDRKLNKSICQRYRLTGIRFNDQNQLEVMPSLVAQHKEDPQLQKELTKLQLMDALIGNRDRHQSNYFIDFDKETGKITVTGVDNDDAYNSSITNVNRLTGHNTAVTLPPVVDREMCDAISNIDENQYRQSLRHLSRDEVNAALGRLRQVKSHLQDLERNGRVIEPGDRLGWGSREVTELFTAKNSYVGRDAVVMRNPRANLWNV